MRRLSLILLAAVVPPVVAASAPPARAQDARLPQVVATRTLTENGGRVDWCHKKNLIAFDRVRGPGRLDVYIVRPDGTGERCLTCGMDALPRGIRGQPAWHPSCDYLVVQVQGPHFERTRFEFVSFGINHDLWFVAADGSWAQKVVEVPALGASLHPHFSDTGRQLFWAVREKTGRRIPQHPLPRLRTPGRENPWDGWHLAIADVERRGGAFVLGNRRDLYRGQRGVFESHALVGGHIYFSHTAFGRPFVDEIYRARADGRGRRKLDSAPGVWQEHAAPSPGGSALAFISSRGFAWRHPPDRADTLRTELWLKDRAGTLRPVTRYNDRLPPGQRAIASDFAWGPNGRSIASYALITGRGRVRQVIRIITFDRPN